jgi:hypothetical protein
MPSYTRRRVLAATSAGLALLAGCSARDDRLSDPPGTRRDPEPVDHEFVSVRSVDEPVVFRAQRETERTLSDRRRRAGQEFVATPSDREELTFADTEAGRTVADFVAETDFAAASVLLWSTAVSGCHEVQLRSVTLQADGDPHLDFCRSVRAADVSCDDDRDETVAYAVRFPIDGSDVNGYRLGMSSSCAGPPEPGTFDATVTVENDGDES